MYKLVQSPADTRGSDKDARWNVAALRASALLCRTLTPCVLALGGAWGSRLTALRPYQPHFSPFPLLFAVASAGSTPGRKHVRSDEWQRLTASDNPRADAN